MANEIKKGTIYQQLNQMLNLDGMGFQDAQPSISASSPSKETKVIIKGNSPEEIHRKGLELEQKRELQNKFFRTTDRGFQKALQYEAARLPLYIDVEGFENYPLVAAALDLFMEEATTIGSNGKMLNVYSNKERIKTLLEEFFYDTINVNVNLPFWTRNMPVKYDSMIPLLTGEIVSIKEIANRLKEHPEKEIWTYSIQNNTNTILPGKIIWCDLTRENTQILKINLDDDTYVETTPDHEFLLRDGSFKRANELESGVSLMPLSTTTTMDNSCSLLYNPASNKYILLDSFEKDGGVHVNYGVVHHKKDCKVLSVENLENSFDAYCMEVVGPNNEQDRHNFPICNKDGNGEYGKNGVFVSNCKYGDNFVLLYGEKGNGITHVKQLVNYEIERLEKIQNGKPIVNFKERMTGDMFNSFEIAHFRLLGDDKFIPYGCSILSKVRRTVRELILVEDAMLTYRLVRAGEKKVFKIDVGNIDDDDVEEYITKVATKFKKVSQVSQNNGQIDYRYNPVGNDEDYFIPQRNANVQTGVETLPGASNLSDIGDIEYLRDNLLVALGIPRPFLSMQDAAGGGKNLAQFDIRFAKKVSRIQQAMIQELNKMAIIHLYLLGYSGEDLKDFTLTLTNPSTQQELLKSELMRDKAQTYTELTRTENGIAAMSHVEAQRLIFNKSDREIVEGLKQQKMERVVMQELQDSPIIIKKSGLFKSLDDKYGEPIEGMPLNTTPEVGNAQGGSLPGGGAPMQNLGGPEIGGGELPGTSTGGAPNMGGNLGGGEAGAPIAESKSNKKLSDEDYTNLLEKMVGIDSSKIRVKQENKKIIIENNKINDDLNKDAMSMISEIDEILKDNNNLNTNQRLDESEDVDLSIIED